MASITTMVMVLKLLTYMNHSKQLSMLTKTINKARMDTLYFTLVLLLLLMGFVGMANITFGQDIKDFSTYGSSFRTCFEIMIGQFDYRKMTEASFLMSQIFFYPFNVLFVLILTNIFLAIINITYERILEDKRQD